MYVIQEGQVEVVVEQGGQEVRLFFFALPVPDWASVKPHLSLVGLPPDETVIGVPPPPFCVRNV
jgi:hypothetical protein